MQSAVLAMVDSVRLTVWHCVWHTRWYCVKTTQAAITRCSVHSGQPHDSRFFVVNVTANFQR